MSQNDSTAVNREDKVIHMKLQFFSNLIETFTSRRKKEAVVSKWTEDKTMLVLVKPEQYEILLINKESLEDVII